MTAASYTSDLVDINLFQATTNINAYGGGGAGLGTGADFKMEGTLCVDKQITNAEKGFLYASGGAFTIGADDHFYIWVMGATPGLCDTRDNRGIVVGIGDSTSAFVKFHVNGGDTLPLGGGLPYAIRFVNTTLTNFRTLVGTPGTAPTDIGGGLSTTASVKSANLGVDAARIGTGYDILNGTGADPEADFAGIAADDASTSEGVFREVKTNVYEQQGKLRIGSAATACEFLDSDKEVLGVDTIHSLTDFTEILIEHADTIVTLTRIVFRALGTNNPGRWEALTSAGVATLTACSFLGRGVTVLGTGSSFIDCVWVGSDIVTANGATLTGSTISEFEGTDDTAALVWNVNTDPDGKLDNMSFTKGTAATHAVEFGTSAPLTQTIRGWTTSGYNASNEQDDSTILFADRGGDVTWTLNVVGGTGEFSYKKARVTDTVVIVVDPVTFTLHAIDSAKADVPNAFVLAKAGDNLGDLPFDETVTIARSGSVATVTHTAHNMDTGDLVEISKAVPAGYNGIHTITVTGPNEYTYVVDSGLSTPPTGTIKATGVIIAGLTNASGLVTDTRSWGADQVLGGVVRKGTSSPVYKTSTIAGAIDKDAGLALTVQMASDE